MPDFCRHDWVWLPENWRARLREDLAVDDAQAVADWVAQKRPLVVARKNPDDAPGLLRLGLALPGKRRIGLLIAKDSVAMSRAPLYFLDVISGLSDVFPDSVQLALEVERHAPDIRVFGSLAWRFFGGDGYVTPASDIDLLLRPQSAAQLAGWIHFLREIEQRFPAPRLDGEIALPDGDFVSWREYAARPKRLLVKSADSVALRSLDSIDALFRARAA